MGLEGSKRGHQKIDAGLQLKRTWRSNQFDKANCSKCFLVDQMGIRNQKTGSSNDGLLDGFF